MNSVRNSFLTCVMSHLTQHETADGKGCGVVCVTLTVNPTHSYMASAMPTNTCNFPHDFKCAALSKGKNVCVWAANGQHLTLIFIN